MTDLVSFRTELFLSISDDPLELLDALHHLGHGAGAVNKLADLGVRELVGGDERDQAHRLPCACKSWWDSVAMMVTVVVVGFGGRGGGGRGDDDGEDREGGGERDGRERERDGTGIDKTCKSEGVRRAGKDEICQQLWYRDCYYTAPSGPHKNSFFASSGAHIKDM